METTLEIIGSIHEKLWKPTKIEGGYIVFERHIEHFTLYTLNVTKTEAIDKLNFEIDGVDYSEEYREYLNSITHE